MLIKWEALQTTHNCKPATATTTRSRRCAAAHRHTATIDCRTFAAKVLQAADWGKRSAQAVEYDWRKSWSMEEKFDQINFQSMMIAIHQQAWYLIQCVERVCVKSATDNFGLKMAVRVVTSIDDRSIPDRWVRMRSQKLLWVRIGENRCKPVTRGWAKTLKTREKNCASLSFESSATGGGRSDDEKRLGKRWWQILMWVSVCVCVSVKESNRSPRSLSWFEAKESGNVGTQRTNETVGFWSKSARKSFVFCGNYRKRGSKQNLIKNDRENLWWLRIEINVA